MRSEPDVLAMNARNGIDYCFAGPARGDRTAARQAMLDARCTVSQKWVDNHFCLILWKLASTVRANPALYQQKWSFAEVIRQLKYR